MQRSLAHLRKEGYVVEIVEHFNFFSKRRIDLLGFADILALKPGEILAVQTTTRSNTASRINKIQGLAKAKAWTDAGGEIVVHGWSKKGPRGKRKLWALTETPVTP